MRPLTELNLRRPALSLALYATIALITGFVSGKITGQFRITVLVMLGITTFYSLAWFGSELMAFLFGDNDNRIQLLCASLSVAAALAAVVFAFDPY